MELLKNTILTWKITLFKQLIIIIKFFILKVIFIITKRLPVKNKLVNYFKDSFLNSFSNYPFLNHYKTVLRSSDMKIPGIYIDIHNSC